MFLVFRSFERRFGLEVWAYLFAASVRFLSIGNPTCEDLYDYELRFLTNEVVSVLYDLNVFGVYGLGFS